MDIINRRHIFSLAALLMLALCHLKSTATVALSRDPNFIKAQFIMVSPGLLPQQSSGHAAIRLECPTYGLDRVFTFENNSGESVLKLFFEGAKGRILEFDYDDFIEEYKPEQRQLTAYPLNFSIDEKARLWEVLDSMKTLPDQRFDVIDSHCFSVIAESLDKAVFPSKINWDEISIQSNSYGVNAALQAKNSAPWQLITLMLPLGTMADTKGNGQRDFVFPVLFEDTYDEFRIVSPDGRRRDLIRGTPEILLTGASELNRPVRPTPVETAMLVLLAVVIITGFQLAGKWKVAGRVLDIFLWTVVTLGGIFIAMVTYVPGHTGGNWNWPLLVLNPIAWIPVCICRKKPRALRVVWIIYGTGLVLFAGFITLISPSLHDAWRILAVALAVRCFFRAGVNRKRASRR